MSRCAMRIVALSGGYPELQASLASTPLSFPVHGRRILQVDITTTDVDLNVTQFVKRELHSLVNYLYSSFSDQALAANITRPFAQRVSHHCHHGGVQCKGCDVCALRSTHALTEKNVHPSGSIRGCTRLGMSHGAAMVNICSPDSLGWSGMLNLGLLTVHMPHIVTQCTAACEIVHCT